MVILVFIILFAVILVSWIVVVAVLVLVIRTRHSKLFMFCTLVSILKDTTHAANVFNWLSYPQLWTIGLPTAKEGWP